ncbi:MAG TPA: class III extradiol ring-cleavage dioxygenase [Candidatus Acidoferrales bacterium]|nr:class III extradiol ring-cleavage dioxygenase [Candidatus Acidoferrales bacterium]
MSERLPTYYLSHGGGPWSFMQGPMRREHEQLEAALLSVSRELDGRAKAILMISGHWEEPEFAVTSGAQPPMVYDYAGFPPELYRIKYPAPGSPELAQRIHSLIEGVGLRGGLDADRGFDHGTYALLAVTHPNANVPVVQVAIRNDYDPEAHLRAGEALAPLRDEGIAIIGSGSSYHNLRRRMDARKSSASFDAWLTQTLIEIAPQERRARLLRWEQLAPFAREAHPTEDHLIPLHVVVGAAGSDGTRVIYHQDDFMGGWMLSSYRFG